MKTFYKVTEEKLIRLFNESWYYQGGKLYPSVTFIQSSEIGYGLAQYFKEHGIYTDQITKRLADIGSLFHHMVECFLKSGSVHYKDFQDHEYFIEAWRRMPNFYNFYEKELKDKHEILEIEYTIINDVHGYAGTMDLKTMERINDGTPEVTSVIHVWDWKSSKQVQDHHKSQVAAYAVAEDADFAHVVCFPEHPRTKQGYSLTTLDREQINEQFGEFLFIKQRFDRTHKQPLFKEIPISFEV
jgi:hypothetical protein